jgi:hypothetical protein
MTSAISVLCDLVLERRTSCFLLLRNSPVHLRRKNEDKITRSAASVTIPAGTRILVRTIDSIDSAKNQVGYRFEASLEPPLTVDGDVVIAKGADVYGRLEQSKQTGTFTGRSELKVELTGIVANGQTVLLVTGGYELSGKSKGESTAKRTVGGAAIGSIERPQKELRSQQGRAWALERRLSPREIK